jgi:hypothetical protein
MFVIGSCGGIGGRGEEVMEQGDLRVPRQMERLTVKRCHMGK